LLRAVPSLLTDFGVNGYLAMIFFGAALLHALVTAPTGVAGQLAALFARLGRRFGGHGGAAQ
jgi:branched-chain amino acid transport system permease protein